MSMLQQGQDDKNAQQAAVSKVTKKQIAGCSTTSLKLAAAMVLHDVALWQSLFDMHRLAAHTQHVHVAHQHYLCLEAC
jgi:hypothetical protein